MGEFPNQGIYEACCLKEKQAKENQWLRFTRLKGCAEGPQSFGFSIRNQRHARWFRNIV